MLAGITIVTVNPALRAGELGHVLGQSRADGIFFVRDYRGSAMAEMLDGIRGELPALREAVSFDEWEAFYASGSPTEPLPDVDPGAAAQIQYTSGTTGRPKGAVLHHCGIVNNARLSCQDRLGGDGMVLLSPMPLFHTAGCGMSVLGSIACAGTLVLPPFFDPGLLLELIEAEKPSCVVGVPTMLIGCVDHPRLATTDVSSVRFVVTGGAVVAPGLMRRVERAFDAPVSVVFAQTEASPTITQTAPDEHTRRPIDHSRASAAADGGKDRRRDDRRDRRSRRGRRVVHARLPRDDRLLRQPGGDRRGNRR